MGRENRSYKAPSVSATIIDVVANGTAEAPRALASVIDVNNSKTSGVAGALSATAGSMLDLAFDFEPTCDDNASCGFSIDSYIDMPHGDLLDPVTTEDLNPTIQGGNRSTSMDIPNMDPSYSNGQNEIFVETLSGDDSAAVSAPSANACMQSPYDLLIPFVVFAMAILYFLIGVTAGQLRLFYHQILGYGSKVGDLAALRFSRPRLFLRQPDNVCLVFEEPTIRRKSSNFEKIQRKRVPL
jgi:hypothetical protein